MDILEVLSDMTTVSFEDKFLADYNKALLKKSKKSEQATPHNYTRPSSLGKCPREIYYLRNQEQQERESNPDWTYNLIGILESGTDRHERIQATLQEMEAMGILKNIDIEKATELARERGTNTEFVGWNEDRTEGRCLNKDYGIYFQPDGLIEYQGKTILFEIKTCSHFKYQKLKKQKKPFEEHLYQATAYALGLDVDQVLFFYEERGFTTHKLFLVDITKDMKATIVDKLNYLDHCVSSGELPRRETDKCQYCKFKTLCASDTLKENQETADLGDEEVF